MRPMYVGKSSVFTSWWDTKQMVNRIAGTVVVAIAVIAWHQYND